MNLELKEFDGGVMCRCEIDLLQEMQRKIDRKLEVDGEKALEIALASRGYFKKRTCHDLGGCDTAGMQVFNCSECGCVLSLFDVSGANTLCTNHIYDYPRYCPECGAKVIGGVTDD